MLNVKPMCWSKPLRWNICTSMPYMNIILSLQKYRQVIIFKIKEIKCKRIN